MTHWYVYIIDKSGKYYTGITTDLKNRLRQHGSGRFLYVEEMPDQKEAAKRERKIKGWSRSRTKKQILLQEYQRVTSQ